MRISIEGPELAAVDFHEVLNVLKRKITGFNTEY